MTSSPSAATPTVMNRTAMVTVLVCWLLVVFDGYDLIVYGTVQTTLINDTGWGLTKATAGTVGSVAFAGMLVGAILAGRISDGVGRKRAVLGCAAVFSVFTILCALAPNAPVFAAFRFLAGVGLGGLVPSANALVAGVVPPRLRAMVATLMMSGVPIGGTIAALSGIWIISRFGWQGMFLIAVIPLIGLLPLGVRYLPNSAPQAKTIGEKAGFSAILRAPFGVISIVFALATMATLFAWYGLGTWLPGLMQQAGYNLGSALTFALTLNLGAVLGSVLTAWAGDRFGSLPTGVLAASIAGAALLVIVSAPPSRDGLPDAGAGRDRHPRHPMPDHRRDRRALPRPGPRDCPWLGPWYRPDRCGRRATGRRVAAGRRVRGQFELHRLRRRRFAGRFLHAFAWKLLTQRQVAAADTKVALLVH